MNAELSYNGQVVHDKRLNRQVDKIRATKKKKHKGLETITRCLIADSLNDREVVSGSATQLSNSCGQIIDSTNQQSINRVPTPDDCNEVQSSGSEFDKGDLSHTSSIRSGDKAKHWTRPRNAKDDSSDDESDSPHFQCARTQSSSIMRGRSMRKQDLDQVKIMTKAQLSHLTNATTSKFSDADLTTTVDEQQIVAEGVNISECTNESYSLCTTLVPTKGGRKGNKGPETWERNKKKKAVNAGEEYIAKDGKIIVKRRKMQPGCGPKCARKCHDFFPQERREELFKMFWSLSEMSKKRLFISKYVSTVGKGVEKSVDSRRKRTLKWCLPSGDTSENVSVCKTFFLHTLNISDQMVFTTIDKLEKEMDPIDRRGRSTVTAEVERNAKDDSSDDESDIPLHVHFQCTRT